MSFDIYAAVTDRIISELEKGQIPWKKPWTGSRAGAISHASGKPYSLLNQMLLMAPGEYVTYKQAQDEGGNVKKGAKSKMVVFWKMLDKQKTGSDGAPIVDKDGSPILSSIPYLQYYNVFHISDCENVAPKWEAPDGEPLPNAAQVDAKASAIFADYLQRSGVSFAESKQDEAYYAPGRDMISLPLMEQFTGTAEYYSTAFHEATHSTGHKKRLDRFDPSVVSAAFGSQDYSKEELIAEIGASAILNEIGLETPDSFKNSAAYIQSWLKSLRNDKKLIVSAAGKAEHAIKLILNRA